MQDHPLHPVLQALGRIEDELKTVADLEPAFLSVPEKRTALLALDRLTTRCAAQQLRVMAAAHDVADAEGHRDVAAWLTHRTRAADSTNRRAQRLASAVERRWQRVGSGLVSGEVNLDQAHVIVRCLGDLSTGLREDADVAPEVARDVVARAEAHLVGQAAHFGPAQLKRLGRRILEVVAPDLADDAERKALDEEERRARRLTSLTTQRLGDGTTLVKARVPDAVADRLQTCLEAFTNPRQQSGADGEPCSLGKKVPYDVRLGRAFCSLLEGLDPSRLPIHGGDATRVVVTIDLDTLLTGLGVATTDSGHRITAGEARRLACTAGIIPAVLGSASEPLDLGRTARLFTAAQRRALALRDGECRADGCTIPAAWTEAHHLDPWSAGGSTDVTNGLLLCSHHHHRIHDDRYLHRRVANGDVKFVRRQ